jgi:hypothetical protein
MVEHSFHRDPERGYKPTYFKDEAGYTTSTHLLTQIYTEVRGRGRGRGRGGGEGGGSWGAGEMRRRGEGCDREGERDRVREREGGRERVVFGCVCAQGSDGRN